MLVSTPPVNSHHPLTNNLTSSNTLHSSLPSTFPSFSTANPANWSIEDVREWLRQNDLNDYIDLICIQHRMNGQRLMNLNENDFLQLYGLSPNHKLWGHIKKLQQFYSSNYRLWMQKPSNTNQGTTIPLTASSYFAPSLSQPPIALRTMTTSPTIQSAPTSLAIPPIRKPSVQMTTSSSSSSSSDSSHTALLINQNSSAITTIPTQQLQNSYQNSTINPNPSITPTTIHLERSPTNVPIRSTTNPQHSQRRSLSQSLSASNTSINILPSTNNPQVTSTLLNNYRTPSDQIEDQSLIDCCCLGQIRADRKKTLSAFLLAICTLYFCSFIITIVDERLPDPKEFRPLPDLILSNVKQIPWAFAVTEKIIVIEMATLISIIVLHRHRLIIIRRLFAIAAALYFLRSLTMVFTSLPVATEKTDCRPEKLMSLAARFKKATLIFIGQGMSSFGVKTCGDYLYSGHTCTLVLATHFINEYSPRSYHLLHFLSWIMAITGMFCILAGHQHYSIDILIAWVLTSRLFIYYHTLANNRIYFQRDKNRMRIWFPFFTYFEENVKQAIPNEYCLPTFLGEARTKIHGCVDRLRYPSD